MRKQRPAGHTCSQGAGKARWQPKLALAVAPTVCSTLVQHRTGLDPGSTDRSAATTTTCPPRPSRRQAVLHKTSNLESSTQDAGSGGSSVGSAALQAIAVLDYCNRRTRVCAAAGKPRSFIPGGSDHAPAVLSARMSLFGRARQYFVVGLCLRQAERGIRQTDLG